MSELGQQIIAEVRKIVAEDPSYRYESGRCAYVLYGQPACLIGKALWNLDVIDASLETHLGGVNTEEVDTLAGALGLDIDPDEMLWLRAAQTTQDEHETWGYAIEVADRKKVVCA